MAVAPVKTTQTSIWAPSDGLFSPAQAYQVRQSGLSGITLPGQGDVTINFGQDEFGNAIPRSISRGTPGTPTLTVQSFLTETRDTIQKMHLGNKVEYLQLRVKGCGTSLKNPSGNDIVLHYEDTRAGDVTWGDIDREFAEADITQDIPLNPLSYALLYEGTITAQTTTETNDANSVWFLDMPDSFADCGNGYPGANKIGYIACDAVGAGTANILYTTDGGSTWAATSADPFAADEHASFITGQVISKTQFRIVVGRIVTDAGNPSEIAYADVTIGDEATTTWTTVNVGSNNGDIITSIFWPETQKLFVANDNNLVFLSEDQGASFTQVYSGASAINQFAKAPNDYIYGAGASNILIYSTDGGNSWSTLTGPTGSNASTAIAVTSKAIWLGNGTEIFYSRALEPSSANQWTSSRDFGANHQVQRIHAKGGLRLSGGSGLLLDIVVSDTTGNEGDIWKTYDGGGFWEEVTNLTNSGYNDAWFSASDDNFAIVVGEDNGSTAVIHKYSA